MKKIETEYLLKKLKEKAVELGKTPTKKDIDSDKTMPHSSTYCARFGGITEACKLIGLPVTKVTKLTLSKAIKLAQNFYNIHGRVPTVLDFNNSPNYPHSSYIRKDLKLTWNQFLILADLPVYTNGDAWIKNIKAVRIIEKFLEEAQIQYQQLRTTNANASNSLILKNNVKICVRYSSPIKDHTLEFWKFRLHLQNKKLTPDYFICVGFNELNQFEKMFLVPINDLGNKQEVISINIKNIKASKYFKYEITSLNKNYLI